MTKEKPQDDVFLKILDLVSVGLDRNDIARYITKKTDWKLSKEAIGRYVRRAQEEIENEQNKAASYRLTESLTRLNYLYKTAQTVQDFKTALACQKEINKLLALSRGDAKKPQDLADDPIRQEREIGPVDEVFAAIDEHLDYLTDDVQVGYPELIAMAGQKLQQLTNCKGTKKHSSQKKRHRSITPAAVDEPKARG